MTTHPSPTALPQLFLPRQVAAPEGPVDMAMMYVAHHAFRRDLAAFCAAAAATPVDDRPTWQALLRRWELFSTALHHHHEGEDAWLWPELVKRAEPHERELLAAMEGEHAQIDPALEACRSGLQLLAATGDADARAALVVRLTAAKEALHRHLAHEETDTMALLQRVLPPAAWEQMDEKFKRSFTPRQLTWVVPWMVAELPDEVRTGLFAQPGAAPLKLVQALFGRRFDTLNRAAFRYLGGSAVPR